MEVFTAVTVIVVGAIFINQAFIRCLEAVRHSEEAMNVSFFLEKAAVNLRIQAWDGLASDADGGTRRAASLQEADSPYDVIVDRRRVQLGPGAFDYFVFEISREGKKLGRTGFLINEKERL